MSKKTVLFGGSFDPVHLGHIKVAAEAIKKLSSEKIFLIPAKRSPFKNVRPVASTENRLDMLKLAVAGNENFEVSDCEFHRTQPSYTIDTVKYFREKMGQEALLYWLIGADMAESLSQWYEISELMDLCRIVVMRRGGFEKPEFHGLKKKISEDKFEQLLADMIETPEIDISSSLIRNKIATGESWSEYLCPEVTDYIVQNKLYKWQ
ncbi:MAG: nicotinate (nicotinamide) nucleotide adenylyltransferase [Anaerohalosphaeraceae bacterium]|nr:nicotinate (nicotinamide) nucleotide adenylyltransferase [Anaerohalosphaeraceae bacterium]